MDVECITKSGHSSNPLLFLVLVDFWVFLGSGNEEERQRESRGKIQCEFWHLIPELNYMFESIHSFSLDLLKKQKQKQNFPGFIKQTKQNK